MDKRNSALELAEGNESPHRSHTKRRPVIPDDHANFHYVVLKVKPEIASDVAQHTQNHIQHPVFEYIGPSTVPHYHIYRLEKRGDDAHVINYHIEQTWKHPRVLHVEYEEPQHLAKRGAMLAALRPSEAVRQLQQKDHIAKEQLMMKDPGFDKQWHLVNRLQLGNDMNPTRVWAEMSRGKGIQVALIDDGIDMDHEDLRDVFSQHGSYDFNDNREIPHPELDDDYHGTRCAGEIAAQINSVCGVGIAYESTVSGIRMLSGKVTQSTEAEAIVYGLDVNDIYSCSWGPLDNGFTVDGPPKHVYDAFLHGLDTGRDGKGAIYVVAAGNGGRHEDNCNYDGYANMVETVTVGAIDRYNRKPYYMELCASQIGVTYSSGSANHIYTTDRGDNSCTNLHGGTSAAAPLGSGIMALALSARPDLTYRDLNHVLIRASVPFSVDTDPSWQKVFPSGRHFSHRYGFGKLDAESVVKTAMEYKSTIKDLPWLKVDIPPVTVGKAIPEVSRSKVSSFPILEMDQNDNAPFYTGISSTVEITKENLQGLEHLEHVQVTVDIAHQRRGDLEIVLKSPHDVLSALATHRERDTSQDGLVNWTFMSVAHWDEDPVGIWTLYVLDRLPNRKTGTLNKWGLTFRGAPGTSAEVPSTPPNKEEIPKRPAHAGGQGNVHKGKQMPLEPPKGDQAAGSPSLPPTFEASSTLVLVSLIVIVCAIAIPICCVRAYLRRKDKSRSLDPELPLDGSKERIVFSVDDPDESSDEERPGSPSQQQAGKYAKLDTEIVYSSTYDDDEAHPDSIEMSPVGSGASTSSGQATGSPR